MGKNLIDLFEPPEGYSFERGIGCTYSVNEKTLTHLRNKLCGYSSQKRAAFENGDKLFRLFFQRGEYIGAAKNCLVEINPDEGCLHAKLYSICYVKKDDNTQKKYRTIVTSANLTNSDELNVYYCFDGDDGTLFDSFKEKSEKFLTDQKNKINDKVTLYDPKKAFSECMAEDIENAESITVVSPFLSDRILKNFRSKCSSVNVVSRADEIERISIKDKIKFFVMNSENDNDLLTEALHAKLYIIDDKIVYLGSANATNSAFSKNIEALVRFETDIKTKSLLENFTEYTPSAGIKSEDDSKKFEKACRKVIRSFEADDKQYRVADTQGLCVKLNDTSGSGEWPRTYKFRHTVEMTISDDNNSKTVTLLVDGEDLLVNDDEIDKEIRNEVLYILNHSGSTGTNDKKEQSGTAKAEKGAKAAKKSIESFTKSIYSTRADKAGEKIAAIERIMSLIDDDELKTLLRNGKEAIEEVFAEQGGQQ